jgi:hypothetical protein
MLKWNRIKYIALLSTVAVFTLNSCESSKSTKIKQLLTGDWSLEAATRNGMETGTLDNLFLEFDTDNKKVRTNLSGQTEDYLYEIEQHIVKLNEGKLKLEIESIDDSVLIVNTMIQDTPFKLWFTR